MNLQDHCKKTPVHYAISSKYVEIVRILADSGANLELKTDKGESALDCAIESGNKEIIKIITEQLIQGSKSRTGVEAKRSRFEDCIVCFNRRHEIFVMIPCGHAKTCETCCLKIIESSESESKCPICRVMVTSYIKAFH